MNDVIYRNPTDRDAAAMWTLIGSIGGLERNTCYAYMLLCTHFATSCLVAEQGGELIGFVLGYRPPSREDAMFVWQVGVHPDRRGQGLATELLERFVALDAHKSCRFLEATVGTGNRASRALFTGFARRRGVACEVGAGYAGELLAPAGHEHEDEDLFRIGPLRVPKPVSMETIERLESNVRSYVRSFPTVFSSARGSILTDRQGRDYLDFFAGAGTLNYGHNNPVLKEALVEHIAADGVTHGLDMATEAKICFLQAFERYILRPRDLSYKAMFPGPTGTNAVEAALKLARKVTGRTNVVAFTNGFHGMTLGALSVTANGTKRGGAGVPLAHVTRSPYDGYFGPDVDTVEHVEAILSDRSGGIDAPAAFIVETVQGEGGVNAASWRWLRALEQLAHDHGALLIVDDIQAGCGRTGSFFSFEEAGLRPDIVTLSKSLSGYGLPFALTLMRPDIDAWDPGEHNGTFRGFNHAFVTATAAIHEYWQDDHFAQEVDEKAELVSARLARIADRWGGEHRGRGLMQGIAFEDHDIAPALSRLAFEEGLIVETSGACDEVIKLLPPLTTSHAELDRGLEILARAAERAFAGKGQTGRALGNGRPEDEVADGVKGAA